MVGTMRASYSGGGSGGAGGGGSGGSGVVVSHAAAEEETGEDAALWSRYEIIRSSIASQLLSGMSQVSSDTYAERDDLLHQLSDEALQREYVQQSEAYLDQGTPPALRGMSEMLLIKLGELMTKPRHVRIAMGQRAREARATAATNASLSASVGEPAIMWKREAEWNRQAYDSLRAALTATLQAPDAPAHAELFKRLCNRHELRLILMTQQEASRLKGQVAHYKEKEKEREREGAQKGKKELQSAERSMRIRHESEMKVLVSEVDALQARAAQSEQRAKSAEEQLQHASDRLIAAEEARAVAEARARDSVASAERASGGTVALLKAALSESQRKLQTTHRALQAAREQLGQEAARETPGNDLNGHSAPLDAA